MNPIGSASPIPLAGPTIPVSGPTIPVPVPVPVQVPVPVPVQVPVPVPVPGPTAALAGSPYIATFYTGQSENGKAYNVPVPGTWNFTNGRFTSATINPIPTHYNGALPRFDINRIHGIYITPGFTLTIMGTMNGQSVQVSTAGPNDLVQQNFGNFTGSVTLAPTVTSPSASTHLQQARSNQPLLIIAGIILVVIIVILVLQLLQ